MSPDRGDSEGPHQSDLKLKFYAGRLEKPILNAIMILQLSLGGIGFTMGGFVLLSKDGLHLLPIAIALLPFVIAYLLTYLYE